MKTMENLCRQFEKRFPNYCAELDDINSYNDCYYICIIDIENNLWSWHIFNSCDDFRSWMNGVVLD